MDRWFIAAGSVPAARFKAARFGYERMEECAILRRLKCRLRIVDNSFTNLILLLDMQETARRGRRIAAAMVYTPIQMTPLHVGPGAKWPVAKTPICRILTAHCYCRTAGRKADLVAYFPRKSVIGASSFASAVRQDKQCIAIALTITMELNDLRIGPMFGQHNMGLMKQ